MIIYGSRMYFKKNVVRVQSVCEHCGNLGRLQSYQAKKFGHLYFIPLIPMGSMVQVIDECSSCKMGAHIPESELPRITQSLQRDHQVWMEAINKGQSEIKRIESPKPVNVGLLIAQNLKDWYCFNEISDVRSITQALSKQNMDYESSLVKGRWAELNGHMEEAKRSFFEASDIRKDDPLPLYLAGTACVTAGDVDGAENAFKRYSFMEPKDISAYVELAGLYERSKNWEKIVRTYDKIFSLDANFLDHKPIEKLYRKACKKSGQTGKYINDFR